MKHKTKLATRLIAIIALVFTAFSWNSEAMYAKKTALNCNIIIAYDLESCYDRVGCFLWNEINQCSWIGIPPGATENQIEILTKNCVERAKEKARIGYKDCRLFFGC